MAIGQPYTQAPSHPQPFLFEKGYCTIPHAMKNLRLFRSLPAALLFVLLCLGGHAQEVHIISVNQPEHPLRIDAGPDQVYDGHTAIVLGGEPSALGGFGDYTYRWEPAEYLDDATAANPTVINLDGPMTFTLTVHDPGALCNKVAEVSVEYAALSANDLTKDDLRIFPNPFVEAVNLESTKTIEEVRVTDMTGQIIAVHRNVQSTIYRLETDPLAMGMYFFIIRFADGSTTMTKLCKIH